MMNSPGIDVYAHKATLLNVMYASKHGYSFVIETCPDVKDMNKDWMWDPTNEYVFVWSKATMVKRHLPHVDYLMFIDSDAYFYNPDYTINAFIQTHFTGDTCIVFGEDCKNKNDCYVNGGLNTGVMFFKNAPQTFALLDAWIDAPNNGTCEQWKYTHPREQACFNSITHANKQQVKVIDKNVMSFGHDGSWIRHMMAMPSNGRNTILRGVMHDRLPPMIESFVQVGDQESVYALSFVFSVTIVVMFIMTIRLFR